MSKIIVVQINNGFYLPVANGLKEIDFGIVSAWCEEGEDVEIREVEQN
jgi:hypothetical protein